MPQFKLQEVMQLFCNLIGLHSWLRATDRKKSV